MNSAHIETKTVKEYLLGTLPDDEAMAIEELYFTNRSVFDEVRRLELALISDYLDGTLASSQREQFESRYLRVPALRKLVEEMRQRRFASASSARRRLLRAGFAAALVCLAVIALMIIVWQPKEAQRASLETKPTDIRLFLEPGVTKGKGTQTQELILPPLAQSVTVVAELPGQVSSADYIAQIFNLNPDGMRKAIWTSGPVRSVPRIGGQEVTLALPSSSFSPGDYILELKVEGGTVRESYLFRVITSRP